MGILKTSNIKVYETNLKLISFSSLYVQNPKIKKKSLFFLGFQINKRRNDKITYNQKKKYKRILSLKKKKESKDVPAVAVKLPTFMFLKKRKKLFSINQKKILKKNYKKKKKKGSSSNFIR